MRLRGTGDRSRSRRLTAGVSAVAVLGLVAGCSGDEEEPAAWPALSSPAASASPTVTPTPTSTKPEPPVKSALAREGTPLGAVEFVRWYLQAYTYARAYGDPNPIIDITTRGCVSCQNIIDRVNKRKAAGQRVVGERFTPSSLSPVPGGTTKHTEVMGFVNVTASKLVDASGKTIQNFGAAKDLQLDIGLTWDTLAGWRVVGARMTKWTRTSTP